MDFRLMDFSQCPNRFLAIVGDKEIADNFQQGLIELSSHSGEQGFGKWDFDVCVGSEGAHVPTDGKPLFLIAENNHAAVDIPKLVEMFQIPIILITMIRQVIPADSAPTYETLSNPVVYGFLENPSQQVLYAAILQAYWMTVAVRALRQASMIIGGVLDGK